MTWAVRRSAGAMLAVLVSIGVAGAQGSVADVEQSGAVAGGRIVREIKDPHSGVLWRLYRDAENPGGPGRLAIAARDERASSLAAQTKRSAPAIHARERVTVEEHSSAVEGYL